jgi:hypothetical protein
MRTFLSRSRQEARVSSIDSGIDMTKSGEEEFSIYEAFRRFADPELLRRLDELEPHANKHTNATQHLYREYHRLFEQIDQAMVTRLKRGELLARGVRIHGPVDEGSIDIAPARWSILEICYETGEIAGPNGLVLVDVMIRMAAPDKSSDDASHMSPNSRDAFTHDAGYRRVCISRTVFKLGPKQASVIRALHDASKTEDPWVHGKSLVGGSIRSQTVRELFKSKRNWRLLIESDRSGLYRLNVPLSDGEG